MNKKVLVIALLIIIIIIFGVSYYILNSSNNNSNSSNNHTFSLDAVAITLNDVDGDYIVIDEKHWTEPGEFTNSTGNGRVWRYTEHYQSNFMENKSSGPISADDPSNKIIQTITRLESNEKATEYVELWTIGHQKKEGYTIVPIDQIGNKSAYFTFQLPYNDYDIDNYLLCFCIDNVVVTIGGGGLTVTESMYLNFAKLIESNILNTK